MNFSQKISFAYKISRFFFLLISLIFLFSSCLRTYHGKNEPASTGNINSPGYRIQEIRERGKLIATTDFNSIDYFIYRGEPMGFQYEKLKMFADYLGVDLEINVVNTLEEAFRNLEEGRSDIIAMGLAVTLDRKEKFDFTEPVMQTRQMLVQRKPENWRKMRTWDDIEGKMIRNPLDLAGKTVVVQKASSSVMRLNNLSQEIGEQILVLEDPLMEVEQLVESVAHGEIEYTICPEFLSGLYERIYPELDIRTPVSFPQNIAWALRQDSDSLRLTFNEWLADNADSYAFNHLAEKYFNSSRTAFMAKSEAVAHNGKNISQYDEILRNISKQYDFDWRLIASLVYQESQFNSNVKSWAGAFGLMQMMPSTAALFGVDSTSTEFEQIQAGILYLKILDDELPKQIKDPEERIKFILAAYNVGIAHVYDARRLAEKNGKDPNVWTGNVDYYILNKSNPEYYRDSVVRFGYARGEETYNFVNKVLERFEHYKNVIND